MNDIICPNCNKVFKVDEAGFADILKQVRDHKFEEELQARLELAENEKISAVKLAEANLKNTLQAELANKDKEIVQLKANSERILTEQLSERDNLLAELKGRLDNSENEKKLLVAEAIKKAEKERDDKEKELIQLRAEKECELSERLFEKDTVIAELKGRIDSAEIERKLSVTEALQVIEKERDDLAANLRLAESEKKLIEQSLIQKY